VPLGDPEWAAVSISDTRAGIQLENLDKIFDPLFTTRAKGIGLGLTRAKTLVEGHGGRIEVESEGAPGKGSTFNMRLPLVAIKSSDKVLRVDEGRQDP